MDSSAPSRKEGAGFFKIVQNIVGSLCKEPYLLWTEHYTRQHVHESCFEIVQNIVGSLCNVVGSLCKI